MVKSHFPIDLGVLTAIRQLIPTNSRIVELGSGNGTNRLTKEYDVYSIEDNENWIGYCEDSNYIHAPIKKVEYDGQEIPWYDVEAIQNGIPAEYDLVLVDGPSGKIGRNGLLRNMHIFRSDVPFVIDDTLREHECQIAREMAFLLNRPLYVFWNFSIISPTILEKETLARIQKAALQVLDQEKDPYLSSYFTITNRIVEPDYPSLDKVKQDNYLLRQKISTLEASQRKLHAVEKSISLKLGRLITMPLRIISNLIK